MKSCIPPLILCLLFAACGQEKEPEPQVTIIGVRPKEAPAPTLQKSSNIRKSSNIQNAGSTFEKSVSKTQNNFNKQKQTFNKKSRQLESEIRKNKQTGQQLTREADTMFEKSSRSLESDMATKHSDIRRSTQKTQSNLP